MESTLMKTICLFVLTILLTTGPVQAEPKYKFNSAFGSTMTEGVTDEFLAKAREEGLLDQKPLNLEKIGNEDLAKVVALKDVLKGLKITNSPNLTDLSPLKELTGLETLYLERLDKLTDLSPIAAVTSLKELEIRQVNYASLDFLAPLDNLEVLKFFMMPKKPSDISSVAGKPKLRIANFYGAEITDISPLTDSKDLEELSLYMTKVADLSLLPTFSKLKK